MTVPWCCNVSLQSCITSVCPGPKRSARPQQLLPQTLKLKVQICPSLSLIFIVALCKIFTRYLRGSRCAAVFQMLIRQTGSRAWSWSSWTSQELSPSCVSSSRSASTNSTVGLMCFLCTKQISGYTKYTVYSVQKEPDGSVRLIKVMK